MSLSHSDTSVGGASPLKSVFTTPGLLWVLLACAAAGYVFYDGLVDLWENWQTPEYSHGPLIPIISGYLLLRQLKHVPEQPGAVPDRWPGFVVLMIALLIGLFAKATHIDRIVSGAVIIWVGGMLLTSFGWSRGKHLWPPVVHLAFMIPLPLFLYWKVSLVLQGVSSELGVEVIRMMGIPVFLDGNIIDLGEFQLHVAEACSGLRYLFPIMSFTYIFAVLYQGSIWHKAVLLLAAIPIAVLMNSVRIGIIGIVVNSFGIEHAEGFMHYFEGWVVFLICIIAMIGLARLMQFVSGDRRSFAEVLDLDLDGLGSQVARIRHVVPSVPMMGSVTIFAASAALWSVFMITTPSQIERDPFLLFPTQVGDWNGLRNPDLEPNIARSLEADDYLTMNFRGEGTAPPVDFFVAWYRDQQSGGIHSPEICLPAGGWEMSEIKEVDIPLEIVVDGVPRVINVPVNRAIIQKGLARQLVYYWFDQGGKRITSDYAAKIWLLWSSFQYGRTDGALLRLVTRVGDGAEAEAIADERLQSLMASVFPVLPQFLTTDLEPNIKK